MALYSLAFHPVDAPILAWFALVPWMVGHGLGQRRSSLKAMALAWYFHFLYVLWWVGEVAWAGAFLVPLLGLPFVLAAVWAANRLVDGGRVPLLLAWSLPFVATEVLRDQVLGLSWSSLGYSQWRWLEGIQSASVFRVHLLSLGLWFANGAIAALILRFGPFSGGRRVSTRAAVSSLGFALLFLAGLQLWGAQALRTLPLEPGPLAVGIQPNISQKRKMGRGYASIWRKHVELLAAAGPLDPDLLVLAETIVMPSGGRYGPPNVEAMLRLPVVPGFPERYGDLLPRGRGQISVLGYIRRRPAPEGDPHADEDGDGYQSWNVAGVIRDGHQLLGEYAKRALVPYGENIIYPLGWPGRESLKRAIRDAGGYIPDLTPGDRTLVVPFDVGDFHLHFGCNICFEVVFPRYFRAPVEEGADFIVNISNDAWYGTSAELDLVHVATRFRAVEERRSIIRVSNSGISTIVDPAGRSIDIVERDGVRKEVAGVVKGRIPICHIRSCYARFGERIPLGFPLILALLLFWDGLLGLRGRRGSAPPR